MALLNNCCALRMLLRELRGDAPTVRFTCTRCGTSYVYRDYAWQPINTADDIRDMMADEAARRNG